VDRLEKSGRIGESRQDRREWVVWRRVNRMRERVQDGAEWTG
jgi:hypothetical protein